MEQPARLRAIATIGVEALRIAGCAAVVDDCDRVRGEPRALEIEAGEQAEIEEVVAGASRAQRRLGGDVETCAQGIDHRGIDLVTAGPDARADDGDELGLSRQLTQRCDAGLDHAEREAAPAGMNRRYGAAIARSRENRNAVRRRDADEDIGSTAHDRVGLDAREILLAREPNDRASVHLLRAQDRRHDGARSRSESVRYTALFE